MEFGSITMYGFINMDGGMFEGYKCKAVVFMCPRPDHDHANIVYFREPKDGGGVSKIGGNRFRNIWNGEFREPDLLALSPSILSFISTNPDVVDFHIGIPTFIKLIDGGWDELQLLPKGPLNGIRNS